jgi:acylglycerol lipase
VPRSGTGIVQPIERREKVSLSKLPIIFFLVLSLASASGCVPVTYHQGKTVGAPRLERDRFLTADGVVLPVRTWQPQDEKVRAVIVALHGFNDYSNFFDSAGNFLSRRGVACYAYDQRGFGNTPRRGYWHDEETYTGDVTSFVDLVRKKHAGVPVYLLGESMGGAISIAAVTRSASPMVDGVILVAPAVWGRDTMPWYQRWLLAIAAHTVPWMELTGDSLDVWPSDNKEMLRKFARDPLVIKGTRVDAVYGLTNLMDTRCHRRTSCKSRRWCSTAPKTRSYPGNRFSFCWRRCPRPRGRPSTATATTCCSGICTVKTPWRISPPGSPIMIPRCLTVLKLWPPRDQGSRRNGSRAAAGDRKSQKKKVWKGAGRREYTHYEGQPSHRR